MKRSVFILILSLLAVSLYIGYCEVPQGIKKTQKDAQVPPLAQQIDELISSAVKHFEKGKADKGASLLLDAIMLSRPRESMPKGFEEKVMAAREQFQKGSLDQGGKFVAEAYQILKADIQFTTAEQKEKFEIQKKEEIAPLAEIVKKRILLASQRFQEGNADLGVLLLLEAIQLTSPHNSKNEEMVNANY